MDSYDLEQVNNIFRKFSLERYFVVFIVIALFKIILWALSELTWDKIWSSQFTLTHPHLCTCPWSFPRPFRPSLTSGPPQNSLRPVQSLLLSGENLLSDITLIGGNDSGIFVSSVQSGSETERAGVKVGHHLLMVGLNSCICSSAKITCCSSSNLFPFGFIYPLVGRQCSWRSSECGIGHLHQRGSSLDPAEMHWRSASPLQAQLWWWVQTSLKRNMLFFQCAYFKKCSATLGGT